MSAVVLCMTVTVGQPHKAQMCNKSENLQQAVKQFTTLHYIQLTVFFRKTWVCQHQNGKPFWILMKQEMMGWQWHQLNHMQIIFILLQTDNHASTSPLSFYARQHICYSAYMPWQFRLSVRLSHRWISQKRLKL